MREQNRPVGDEKLSFDAIDVPAEFTNERNVSSSIPSPHDPTSPEVSNVCTPATAIVTR